MRSLDKMQMSVSTLVNLWKYFLNIPLNIIELPSSSGERGTCNINFLNTELLQDYEILEKGTSSQLHPLDMNKINQRTEQNLMRRQQQSDRIGVGVSPLAQKLFDLVSKT